MENVFDNTVMYAVLIGVPVAITIGITNFLQKGDNKRLILGLISTGLLVVYFWMVLGSINLGFEGDGYTYNLTMPGIILLTVVACIIRGLFFVIEFYTYKKRSGKDSIEDGGIKEQVDTKYY